MKFEDTFILLFYIFVIIFLIFFIKWFYKEYKQAKEDNLQFLVIMILISVAFPVVVFYLDHYNVFTKLGYLSNASGDNWIDFFATYGSTLVSTLISSIFLVWVTSVQIYNAKEDNNVQLKMQNLPVLKFFSDDNEKSASGSIEYIDCSYETSNFRIQLNLKIKNVGLGTAQNIEYQLIFGNNKDIFKSSMFNEIIEKNGESDYTIFFEIPSDKLDYNRQFVLLVFYDDLLDNKYVQVLTGTIGICKSLTDMEEVISPYIFVHPSGKHLEVNDKFDYKELSEVSSLKEFQKFQEHQHGLEQKISNRNIVDFILADFFKEKNYNICDIIYNFFKQKYPNLEGTSGVIDYIPRENDSVEVLIECSMGIDTNMCVVVLQKFLVDVSNKKVKSCIFKIIKCDLKISCIKKFKFRNYLNKYKI